MLTALRALVVFAFLGMTSALAFTGQFLPVVTYKIGNNPVFVAVGDFNGDGIPDLVTSSQNSQGEPEYSVLIGNGDGSFQSAHNHHGGLSRGVAVADLNNDGKLDLIFGNGNVVVLLGRGDGTFAKKSVYAAGVITYGVVTADLNGDGKIDVLIPGGGGAYVLLGNGDGTLQAATVSDLGLDTGAVSLADVNGDGKLDFVATDIFNYAVAVALGNGDGTFQAALSYSFGLMQPSGLAVADFNHDGKLDLVVALGGELVFLPGNGDGTFGPMIDSLLQTIHPFLVGVGDFNHNGTLDVAVAHTGPDLELELGSGDGRFRDSGPYPLNSDPLNGAVADFNCDGWPDVVVPGFNARNLSVLINQGKTRN